MLLMPSRLLLGFGTACFGVVIYQGINEAGVVGLKARGGVWGRPAVTVRTSIGTVDVGENGRSAVVLVLGHRCIADDRLRHAAGLEILGRLVVSQFRQIRPLGEVVETQPRRTAGRQSMNDAVGRDPTQVLLEPESTCRPIRPHRRVERALNLGRP